ncbi:hypothetical protein RXV86_07155 [Alisedimentitalea sp. MJ-SS2]|uniref:hypothetical protein n=1 Tax=Aliisedimentitalea sp. MJ-SS2 TaxID=3049795 RepID=UPI00290CA49C|nr:hypothetical protein [Alisedimentitalea sp. MJ-SS2]MDU8927156.1 hypothetical protein [Alisedimentitalea sp. MJ-SS2]
MGVINASQRYPTPIRALARLGLALCLIAGPIHPASAGAWPRDKRSGFVSVASRVSATSWAGPHNVYSTVYLEYGLGRNLTAGVDIGHGISGTGKAVFFLRKSLPPTPNGHIFAGELGLGLIAGEPAIRPGLSYGKDLSRRGGRTGWLSLETTAEIRLDSGQTDFKADVTLGLNHGDRFKSMLQVQTGIRHGDPGFVRAAPSVAIKVGKKTHLELGGTAGLIGDKSYGFKIGFWRSF